MSWSFAVSWRGFDTVYDWFSRTSTLEWRFALWRDTLAIVRDFPWFGTGLNTYGVSTLVYPMSDPSRHAVEAHSDYVQILSEGGIVLAVAAAFVVLQAARAIRAAFAQPQTASSVLGANRCHARPDRDRDPGADRLQPADPGNAVLFVLLAAIAMHRPPRHERPTRSGSPGESDRLLNVGRFSPLALRIGFDLDGVLADMEAELVRQAEILFGEPMTRRLEERTAPDADGVDGGACRPTRARFAGCSR